MWVKLLAILLLMAFSQAIGDSTPPTILTQNDQVIEPSTSLQHALEDHVYFVGANEKVGMREEVEERKVQFQIRPGRKGKGSQGGANIIHRPHKNHATSLISKSTLSGGTVASLLLLFVLPN